MKLEIIAHAPRMTIVLAGRLNADTAPSLEAVLDQQLQEITELVFDVDGLEYVSSVGLRVFLLAQQKMKAAHGTLLLKNVGQPIAEILEVTGLERILHFERKHRELSMEGLKMIAKGANGECYKVDEETVVKLYFDFVDKGCAEREKALATKAFVAGVPTALSFDVVQCGTRTGVMYEMLKADTLALYMEKNLERLNDVVAMYVRFCKQIHAIAGDTNNFPDAVTLACGYVDACEFFNDRQRAFLKERLMRTERPGTLIHWDLHPGNIMMQGDSLCLIDMGDMAVGTPYFDLGQIKQVLHYYAGLGLCHKFIGLGDANAMRVWQMFVAGYFDNPEPDALKAIEADIDFYRAIKNVYLYLCSSGGETMRARRKDFIFQMLPKEFADLK